MCLHTITKTFTDKDREHHEEFRGFKVVRKLKTKTGEVFYRPIYSDMILAKNSWQNCSPCPGREYAANMKPYYPGFHVFTKRGHAIEYYRQLHREVNHACYVVVRLMFRGLVYEGIQTVGDQYFPCFVCKEQKLEVN